MHGNKNYSIILYKTFIMKKKIVLVVVVVLLIGIQFIRIDQSVPYTNPQSEYFVVASVPSSIQTIMKESCFDCHSNHTTYPWYANIAPASWMLQNHIKEGREHLNFSEWGNYSSDDRNKMLEEALEEVEKDNMPLKPYVLMHPEAKLSSEEKDALRQWFLGNSATSVVAALN